MASIQSSNRKVRAGRRELASAIAWPYALLVRNGINCQAASGCLAPEKMPKPSVVDSVTR